MDDSINFGFSELAAGLGRTTNFLASQKVTTPSLICPINE
jgi:hypothetical protein